MWFGSLAGLLVTVRPGMTGLWAVSGRSSVQYPGRAFIELQYVTRASLWLDLRILARTLTTIFSGRGAI
jgi:lipopolysaccharide/colanic/teichoic acid biosynthesis glycosyltransferase